MTISNNTIISICIFLGILGILALLVVQLKNSADKKARIAAQEQAFQAERLRLTQQRFQEDFKMSAPPIGINVTLHDVPTDYEEYILAIPYWAHARKDGTRDQRYNLNQVVRPMSTMRTKLWSFTATDPFTMNAFVVGLRRNGHALPLCHLEMQKQAAMREQDSEKFVGTSVIQLYARFMNDSAGFEEWCANQFRHMGAEVIVTPPANDGGYDLDIREGAVRTLAECKCYHPTNGTIGRPLLQKLVGANATEHANQLMFIATCEYSAPAIEYAEQQGITLINGKALIELHMKNRPSAYMPKVALPDDWFLTNEDILACYPSDCRPHKYGEVWI